MWEIIILGLVILTVIAMAIWREGVRPIIKKTKPQKVTVIREVKGGQTVDVEELATKIAQAVAATMSKELLDKLDNLQIQTVAGRAIQYDKEGAIEMDESIIPIAIEAAIDHVNVDGMAIEEEAEDKGLAAAKSKLANLLKRKKNKDDR